MAKIAKFWDGSAWVDLGSNILAPSGPVASANFALFANTASFINISGLTGLGSNVSTFLITPTSANLAAAITNETGDGKLVFSTSSSFDGIPTAPTASVGSNTNQIATTAFVYSMLTGIDAGIPSSTYEFSIDGGTA